MLFETAVTMLEKRLGQRQDLTADIKESMQFVQDYVLETDHIKFEFQLTERQTAFTAIGDDRVAHPPMFLAEYEEGSLFLVLDGGAIIPLIKEDLEGLVRKFGATQGQPIFYARSGSYFRLYPIPEKQYTLRMISYDKAATLIEGEENVWLKYAADWLLAETGKLVAVQILQNTNLAATFNQQAVDARQRLWRSHEASLAVNRDMIKGF